MDKPFSPDSTPPVKVRGVDLIGDGVVIGFSNGRETFYPAEILYAMAEQLKDMSDDSDPSNFIG